MKTIGFLLIFLSPVVFAGSYPSCNINEKKAVSFRSTVSKDILLVSVIGSPCHEAKLKISVKSGDGKLLYSYESKYKKHNAAHWAEPDFDQIALKHVKNILEHAITKSSSLPSRMPCELDEPGCEPYERRTVPKKKFNSIKASNIPMLTHSTYYEGWASFVFDSKTEKTIKILEGGV